MNRLLLLVLLVATIVRFVGIDDHGIWNDEQLSLSNAAGSVLDAPLTAPGLVFTPVDFWANATLQGSIRATVAQDSGNGILFVSALRLWLHGVGTGDGSIRALSACFGLLCVLLVHQVTRGLTDETTALVAAFLCSIHPLLVRYSQEVRGYALATALTLLATLCVVRLMNEGYTITFAAIWGLLAGAALLTHYLTVYLLAAQLVFAIVHGRHLFKAAVLATAIAIPFVALWFLGPGREGLRVMSAQQNVYAVRAANYGPAETFALPASGGNIVAGWLQGLLAMSGNALQATGTRLSTLAPLAVVPLALFFLGVRALWREHPLSGLLVVMLALSGPLVATVLAIRAGHIIPFQILYMNFGAPYMMITIAKGLVGGQGSTRRFAQVRAAVAGGQIFILVTSVSLVLDDAPWHRARNKHREIARRLTEAYRPNDEVQFTSWRTARLTNLYFSRSSMILQRVVPSSIPRVSLVRRGKVEESYELWP